MSALSQTQNVPLLTRRSKFELPQLPRRSHEQRSQLVQADEQAQAHRPRYVAVPIPQRADYGLPRGAEIPTYCLCRTLINAYNCTARVPHVEFRGGHRHQGHGRCHHRGRGGHCRLCGRSFSRSCAGYEALSPHAWRRAPSCVAQDVSSRYQRSKCSSIALSFPYVSCP